MLAWRAQMKQIKGMADLTDVQWEHLKPLVEWNQKRRPDGRGRPFSDARRVWNGVLWILRTGAPWQDLPSRYGPPRPAIGASSSGSATACWTAFYGPYARTYWPAANSGWRRPSSTPRSSGQKRGRSRWSNTLRQREQDHGNRGPPWPSSRRRDYKRFAT